jgi:PAS domain S-box-containing protein
MAKRLRPRVDVCAAVEHLADEILNRSDSTPDTVALLDHLRRRVRGAQALLWRCNGARASCVAHSGDSGAAVDALGVDLDERAAPIARLRHHGSVLRRAGEVSGLEHLMPDRAPSFAAAGVVRRDALVAVLVVGWSSAEPPCDEGGVQQLRLAAALLATTLPADTLWEAAGGQDELRHAAFDALALPALIVDRRGAVVAVNAAWGESGGQMPIGRAGAIATGTNYFDAWRTADSPKADALIAGIASVCEGVSTRFETTLWCESGEAGRSYVVVAAPLGYPAGGAVITHVDVTAATVSDHARRLGEAQFEQLADTLPVPIWVSTPDGRLLFGNEHWMEALGRPVPNPQSQSWADAVHPADRPRVLKAFHVAVSKHSRFEMEFRLKAGDGSYRWSSCTAAPRTLADGHLHSYVGACWDISAKRRAEATLSELAGKLVVAQETERARVARELHDDVGQQVAMLASQVDAIIQTRQARATNMRAALKQTHALLQDLATTVHDLSHQLHPAKLRLLGLAQTLESLCRDESRGTGVRVQFQVQHVPSGVPEDLALCLFRVAQEALRNALRHSNASSVKVRLKGKPSAILLEVSDNGVGVDPLPPHSGLGFLTMRERVELAGGAFSVQPARPRGTTIRAAVQLPRSRERSPYSVSEPQAVIAGGENHKPCQ